MLVEFINTIDFQRKIGEEAQANIENSVWLSNLDWSRCRNEVELIESKILVANSQLRSANCDVMKKFNAKEYVNQEWEPEFQQVKDKTMLEIGWLGPCYPEVSTHFEYWN